MIPMRRFIPLLAAVLACAPVALPAQQPEQNTPAKDAKAGEKKTPADKDSAAALEGTKWKVIYNDNNNLFAVFEFRKDGVFVCGGTLTGSWKRDGKTIRMRTPDGAEFEGTVKDDTISGKVSVGKGENAAEYRWKGKKE